MLKTSKRQPRRPWSPQVARCAKRLYVRLERHIGAHQERAALADDEVRFERANPGGTRGRIWWDLY